MRLMVPVWVLNNPFTLSSYHAEWATGGLPPIETGGPLGIGPRRTELGLA